MSRPGAYGRAYNNNSEFDSEISCRQNIVLYQTITMIYKNVIFIFYIN